MNIQEMMRQAQKLQKDMAVAQKEISESTFESTSGMVEVKVNGKKEIQSFKINSTDDIKSDDIEMLEDMIQVAINTAFSKVDKLVEQKMGRFGNIPGLM